jgi:hypothetical protein
MPMVLQKRGTSIDPWQLHDGLMKSCRACNDRGDQIIEISKSLGSRKHVMTHINRDGSTIVDVLKLHRN